MGLSMTMSLMVTRTMEEIVLYHALPFNVVDSVDLGGLWEHILSVTTCPSLSHMDIRVRISLGHLF